MYLKSFYNNSIHSPTQNEKINFDWSKISNFYFANRMDTVSSYPEVKQYQSHDMGLVIMFYSPDHEIFNDRLPNYVFRKSKKHIKSKFWKLVYKKLEKEIVANYR